MKDIPEAVREEFPDLCIKDYTITGVIGEGGQGVVLQLEKDGVVYTGKVVHRTWSLTPWIEDLKGLRRGVELSEALNHPSIQKVNEVIDEKEKRRFTVVKEYAPGRSLREILDVEHNVPPERLVEILDKTLDALAYLHDASQHPSVKAVFHRDIKPEHIIVRDDGHITLIDLDSAKPSGGRTTQYTAAGTRIYSAPESLLGTNDARSDLYSLGFVAAEALLGEVPEELSDSRLLSRRAYNLPHSIPEKLRTVVDRMVLAEPEQRFQNALDVRSALGKCLEKELEAPVAVNDELAELKREYVVLEEESNMSFSKWVISLVPGLFCEAIAGAFYYAGYHSMANIIGTFGLVQIVGTQGLLQCVRYSVKKKHKALEEKIKILEAGGLEIEGTEKEGIVSQSVHFEDPKNFKEYDGVKAKFYEILIGDKKSDTLKNYSLDKKVYSEIKNIKIDDAPAKIYNIESERLSRKLRE